MTHLAPPPDTPDPDLPPQVARVVADGPEETAALAARLAPLLGPGNTVLLSGELGSGKTHFARALIQARLAETGEIEEVPSPSFTLVQTYRAGALEIWHCDLYRLGGPGEAWELGLDDALEDALCLVEWPERMAGHWPGHAVWLRLAPDAGGPDRRVITLHAAAGTPLAARLAPVMAAAR